MTAETDRALALRVLRDTLRDMDAKPAERVSAAKLLLEHEAAAGAGPGALHALRADELLSIARGQGDTPPLMGPVTPHAVAVPSQAREDHISPPPAPAKRDEGPAKRDEGQAVPSQAPAKRDEGQATPTTPLAIDKAGLGRTPGAFLKRGPKTDPAISPTPGGIPPMGPKKESPILPTPPPNLADVDPLS